MRIKINDKIYRLKEIESGVDSLMELVEEPRYKDGDFLHSDWRNENITIIYRKRNGNHLYYHVSKSNLAGLCFDQEVFCRDDGDFRLATESEKKELIDALTGVGKRWNAEKKRIENIPVYKDGDFVVSEFGSILIFKEADGNRIFDHAYLPSCGELVINIFASYEGVKRHATTEEKKRMIEALAEQGKRWNNDKKCVEDIPKPKFKAGDKVKIKDGISSDTHRYVSPNFTKPMDKFIGKELTVKEYSNSGFVVLFGDYFEYHFNENWLEPCIEEPKKGDLAIFWNNVTSYAIIRVYDRKDYNRYYDILGNKWENAIKFESKEQFEKVMKGEI